MSLPSIFSNCLSVYIRGSGQDLGIINDTPDGTANVSVAE
jgi:hypothetical protein